MGRVLAESEVYLDVNDTDKTVDADGKVESNVDSLHNFLVNDTEDLTHTIVRQNIEDADNAFVKMSAWRSDASEQNAVESSVTTSIKDGKGIVDVTCDEFVVNGLHYLTFKSGTITWTKGYYDIYNSIVTEALKKLVGKTIYSMSGAFQRDDVSAYGLSSPMMNQSGAYDASYGHHIWIDMMSNPKRIKVYTSSTWTNYHVNLLIVYGD